MLLESGTGVDSNVIEKAVVIFVCGPPERVIMFTADISVRFVPAQGSARISRKGHHRRAKTVGH
jgi:hypothetical protein